METLVRDCTKLGRHQAAGARRSEAAVDAAIEAVAGARGNPSKLEAAQSAVAELQRTVGGQQRELYGNVSKYGRHVEKAFTLDVGLVCTSPAFEGSEAVVAQAVHEHLVREGDSAAAQKFAEEGGMRRDAGLEERFLAMHASARALRAGDVRGAVAWAQQELAQGRGELLVLPLDFRLQRLRFLQLVEAGNVVQALAHARATFPRHVRAHGEEIEQLMGLFAYAQRLAESPYKNLFADTRWDEGAAEFTAAFCAQAGEAAAAPLGVAAGAGARAVAVVAKVAALLRDRRAEWSQQNELAVEVPLPDSMRFHSVFACPVSKEQASPTNPPMMMPCGHVVCRASLDKLARGVRAGAAAGRFKCPYCPGMSALSEAKRVYF
ncbi:hypothetical protein GGF46_003596 [Coemansia sp. RSA 552]|nr:hypothetical protein GGF46_003596 [Coemansia sp. RSA 552]